MPCLDTIETTSIGCGKIVYAPGGGGARIKSEPFGDDGVMYDISKDKVVWQEKKRQSTVMSAKLAALGERYMLRAGRMKHCAEHMTTEECPHCSKRRVVRVDFCRDRLCPVCSWRRSRVLGGRISSALNDVGVGRVNRAVFLTLTVRNCAWADLSSCLDLIADAWRKMSQVKRFKTVVKGYVKTVEVTRGRDGLAHPHVHVILIVSPQYFSKAADDYIEQHEWVQMWQEALGVDYAPSVNIRAVKNVDGAAAEVSKYVVKAASLFHLDADAFAYFVQAVKGRRFFSVGGVMRQSSADVDVDGLTNDELLSDNNGSGAPVCPDCGSVLVRVEYEWSYSLRDYRVFSIGGVFHGCNEQCYKDQRLFET